MKSRISKRLADIVNALPLFDGARVLEIGCGPGVAAREIFSRVGNGYVLGIDRSAKAIVAAENGSLAQMATGSLRFLKVAIEEFELDPAMELFDIAVAVRVGALDGRHSEIEARALLNIQRALKPVGKLFIDGGDPLKIVPFPDICRGSWV